jgi:hypothetical protein
MSKIEELKAKADQIRSSKSSWATTTDGSYEMALHEAGYWKLLKEIEDLEKDLPMSDCDRDNLIFRIVSANLVLKSVEDLENFYMEQMIDWYNDWSDEELESLK